MNKETIYIDDVIREEEETLSDIYAMTRLMSLFRHRMDEIIALNAQAYSMDMTTEEKIRCLMAILRR